MCRNPTRLQITLLFDSMYSLGGASVVNTTRLETFNVNARMNSYLKLDDFFEEKKCRLFVIFIKRNLISFDVCCFSLLLFVCLLTGREWLDTNYRRHCHKVGSICHLSLIISVVFQYNHEVHLHAY